MSFEEQEMHESGKRKYLQAIEEAKRSGNETRNNYGQKLLSKEIVEIEKRIETYLKGTNPGSKVALRELAGHIPADVLALFTLEAVISVMSKEPHLTKAAEKLGERVEREVRWRKVEEKAHYFIMRKAALLSGHEQMRYLRFMDAKVLPDEPVWSKREHVSVGFGLIGLLCDADVGFKLKTVITGEKRQRTVVSTDDRRASWVQQLILNGAINVADLEPMLCEPVPWTAEGGGYVSHFVGEHTLVRGDVDVSDMFDSHVVKSLNRVQEEPWEINQRVMEVFSYVMDQGLASKVNGMLTTDSLGTRTVLQSHYSTAKKLGKQRFWIPHNFCWRGRFMALPAFSFQGPDYCRGLMRFSDAQPIGRSGHRWISLHMANSYGDDKIPKEKRHEWADKHIDLVGRVATDPVGSFSDWSSVDAPWQFLASCFEYWEWHNDWHRSPSYFTGLPIGMDGSSNAIQHGSAFLRDSVGASWVNMTPKEDSEVPADLYRKVCDAVNVELNRRADSGDAMAMNWLWLGVTRSTVKRIVMTRGYAGSKFGASDMIVEDTLNKLAEIPFDSKRVAAVYLGQLTHDKSMEVLKGLAGTMEFLQGTVGDEPVQFTMPNGFKFRQAYWTKVKKKIDVASSPIGRVQLVLSVDTNKIDKRKMKAGIAANFTHATDACHLSMVVGSFDGPMGMVHDSYSTTASHCDRMYEVVRREFAELHKLDILKWYQERVAFDKKLPAYGTYDVKQIMEAPYAFL